jgi:hypothetical protein
VACKGQLIKQLERQLNVALFAHVLPHGGYAVDVKGTRETLHAAVKLLVSFGAEGALSRLATLK